MMKLADFANASKELKAIEESNAILDYNLLKDLKLVNAEYSMEEYLTWHERQCRKLKELSENS